MRWEGGIFFLLLLLFYIKKQWENWSYHFSNFFYFIRKLFYFIWKLFYFIWKLFYFVGKLFYFIRIFFFFYLLGHSNFCCEIGFKGQVPKILERWSLVSDQMCVKKMKNSCLFLFWLLMSSPQLTICIFGQKLDHIPSHL